MKMLLELLSISQTIHATPFTVIVSLYRYFYHAKRHFTSRIYIAKES